MSTLVIEVAGGAIAASPPLALIGLALVLVPQSRQRILAVTSIGVLIVWYAVAYVALSRGALGGVGPGGIPKGALAFIPAAVAAPIVALAPAVRRLLAGGDVRAGLIALQTYRVLGGGSFLLLLAVHRLPLLFAIPAGVGDILVGLSAWSAASAVRRGRLRRGVAWNVLGLLDLVIAITLGIASSPAFHLSPDGLTSAALWDLPVALIPAFLVPVSFVLHVGSLRSLAAARAGVLERRRPPVTSLETR